MFSDIHWGSWNISSSGKRRYYTVLPLHSAWDPKIQASFCSIKLLWGDNKMLWMNRKGSLICTALSGPVLPELDITKRDWGKMFVFNAGQPCETSLPCWAFLLMAVGFISPSGALRRKKFNSHLPATLWLTQPETQTLTIHRWAAMLYLQLIWWGTRWWQ